MIRNVLPVRTADGGMHIQVISDRDGNDTYRLTRYAALVWMEQIATWLRETDCDDPKI